MKVPFYDLLGAVVTVMLLAAVIAYPLAGHAIPEELRTAFTVSMGWIFRGVTQVANEYAHRKEDANDA